MIGDAFSIHHITLSVRDVNQTASFYEMFGFNPVLRWTARDESLTIAHLLKCDNLILELFQYAENADRPRLTSAVGNDLNNLGMKHIAFKVEDIRTARARLLEMSLTELTEVRQGRTGIEYFFITDPDGNWIEIVEDNRSLDSGGSGSLASTS